MSNVRRAVRLLAAVLRVPAGSIPAGGSVSSHCSTDCSNINTYGSLDANNKLFCFRWSNRNFITHEKISWCLQWMVPAWRDIVVLELTANSWLEKYCSLLRSKALSLTAQVCFPYIRAKNSKKRHSLQPAKCTAAILFSFCREHPVMLKYIGRTNCICTVWHSCIILYCYWLPVSAPVDHHKANIYKKEP